jgi:hypothetical protein
MEKEQQGLRVNRNKSSIRDFERKDREEGASGLINPLKER